MHGVTTMVDRKLLMRISCIKLTNVIELYNLTITAKKILKSFTVKFRLENKITEHVKPYN